MWTISLDGLTVHPIITHTEDVSIRTAMCITIFILINCSYEQTYHSNGETAAIPTTSPVTSYTMIASTVTKLS